MRPLLSLVVFATNTRLANLLEQFLLTDRYKLNYFESELEFLLFIEKHKQLVDCLILHQEPQLLSLTAQLRSKDILLPTVIYLGELTSYDNTLASQKPKICYYHLAEVTVTSEQINHITDFIEEALTQFLHLTLEADTTKFSSLSSARNLNQQHSLMQQQLSEKLRERLGYLGVYYKRNPSYYLRNLPRLEQQELLDNLKEQYRNIVLNYFSSEDSTLNQKIDNLVNIVFFADVAVTTIVEIHMDLMDEFSKQLKLEGRSEEVLLDYRLTLIDTIAHLCEMYRRSIPRES